ARTGPGGRRGGGGPPQRRYERREDGRDAEQLVCRFVRIPLVPGADAPGRARRGDGRLEHRHDRPAAARELAEEFPVEWQIPPVGRLPRKATTGRQLTAVEQVPDVLERPAERELDRVVASVDEPPRLCVAGGGHRLANGHVLESAGGARRPRVDVANASGID